MNRFPRRGTLGVRIPNEFPLKRVLDGVAGRNSREGLQWRCPGGDPLELAPWKGSSGGLTLEEAR